MQNKPIKVNWAYDTERLDAPQSEYRKAIATLIAGSEGLHKAIGLLVDSLQQVIEEKKSG